MTRPRDDQAPPPTPTRARRSGWKEWLFGSPAPSSVSVGADLAEVPKRIGRYRVLHKIGQGGMGTVFAAEDESLGRRLAIKTITNPDEEGRKRFWREARAAASLSHPHVCQVFEIAEDEGRLFIAMELLDGESLSDRLRSGSLPVAEALTLGREMLSALAALHAQGVIHRDLKPSNVFLTPHGTKLLDFGLARPLPADISGALSLDSDLTRSGLLVGTPRYMAPEQILGDEVDARTDLFAAGALLFEALAGRPAFPGAKAVEVMHATLNEQPPALAGSSAVVAFDRVIRRALAKSPAERYPSAEAMSRDLSGIALVDSGESATQASPLTRLIVLPFRVLRPDPEIDFLSLALSDAVSSSLRGLPSLVVRSSAAGARFTGDAPDLNAIAAELDVDLVLLGTLLRSGDRLRVSTQLVEAPGGTLTWSHTAQSEVGDVFRLQDDLAQGIVASLSPSLGGAPRKDRPGEAPASARAYEFYLRGNEVARDLMQMQVARDLYLRCVEEDPGFAPAWAHLGRAHRVIGKYVHIEEVAQHRSRAEEALRRALELSPGLPVAHKFYAHLESELGRAKDAMVRLLQLSRETRNDPELFAGLVHVCRYSGLLDASLAAHREAQRLDPNVATGVVHTLWNLGDFDGMLKLTGSDAHMSRSFALLALGRKEEAIEAWEDVAKGFGQQPTMMREWIEGVRKFLTLSGDSGEAVLRNVEGTDDPEEIFWLGTQAARLGMREGIALLARGVDGGYPAADTLARHPWIEPIRSDSGFADVLGRAESARQEAADAFREAGGPRLLGL